MAFVRPFPTISESKPFRVEAFLGGYWLHEHWYKDRDTAEFQASSASVRTGIEYRVIDERYELDEAVDEEHLRELYQETYEQLS